MLGRSSGLATYSARSRRDGTHIKKLDDCFGQFQEIALRMDCVPKATAAVRRFAVSASPSAYGRPPYETYVVGLAGLTLIAVCKRVSAGAVNIGEVRIEDVHLGAQLRLFGR